MTSVPDRPLSGTDPTTPGTGRAEAPPSPPPSAAPTPPSGPTPPVAPLPAPAAAAPPPLPPPQSVPAPVRPAAGVNGASRRVRWGLLFGAVLGWALVLLAGSADWLSTQLSVFEGQGSYASEEVDVALADVEEAWAVVFRMGVVALAALVGVAVAGPRRLRRGAAATALVAAALTAVALVAGWADLHDAAGEFARGAIAVSRSAPAGQVIWSINRSIMVVATCGLVLLTVVAAHVLWPHRGALVLAVAGGASALLWVGAPFGLAWVPGRPDRAAARGYWLPDAGASGWLAASLAIGLAVVAAVATRSPGSRLYVSAAIMLGAGAGAAAGGVSLDPVQGATYRAGAGYAEATFSPAFLALAVVFLVLATAAAARRPVGALGPDGSTGASARP